MLGLNGTAAAKTPTHIPSPDRPTPPSAATDEWIWIPVSNAQSQTLALAMMRKRGLPVKPKDLAVLVTEMLPDATMNGVYNLTKRLEGKVINKTSEGLELIDPTNVAILEGDVVWGHSSIFSTQELASHRRDAILHILKFFKSGLQIVQLVEELRKCPWMKAPATKDLLRGDVDYLEGIGKIKRSGNSKKWILTDSD
jgi:hypothetical protein